LYLIMARKVEIVIQLTSGLLLKVKMDQTGLILRIRIFVRINLDILKFITLPICREGFFIGCMVIKWGKKEKFSLVWAFLTNSMRLSTLYQNLN